MYQLDFAKTPYEAEVLGQFEGEARSAVQAARAAGIPWVTIFALLVKYGPMFIQIIKEIIEALQTPVSSHQVTTPG